MLILQMPPQPAVPPGAVPFPQWGREAPGYAKVFGLTIGVNSMRGMERVLGAGLVIPGNHEDSGREWHVRGSSIFADGVKRDPDYLSWERLEIYHWSGRLDALPHFRPWTGTIGSLRCGMSLGDVRRQLGKGWTIDRKGLLSRQDRRRVTTRFGPRTIHYRAWFGFGPGGLNSLSLASKNVD